MIVKSLSRKSKSFGQLLSYINAPSITSEPVLYNLSCRADHKAMEHAFMDNAEPVKKRKNGVYLYHEILSFHEADSKYIDAAILSDLAREWLSLRAPGCIGYARAHLDTDHPHIHCMISANEIFSSKKFRLSRSQFKTAKKKLEAYQQQKYPQLAASLVQSSRKSRNRLQKTTGEGERDRRLQQQSTPELSQKEHLRSIIESCLSQAKSEGDYRLRLVAAGLELYQRGKHLGVIQKGKKYRLATLGLEYQEQVQRTRWQRVQAALKDFRRIAMEKLREKMERKHGFRDRIQLLLELQKGAKFLKPRIRSLSKGRGF